MIPAYFKIARISRAERDLTSLMLIDTPPEFSSNVEMSRYG
jgi:hypothetical protein